MPLIPITVNVYMGDPTPIPEVRLSAWTEDYDLCVYDGQTDSNGVCSFALDEGIYNIFLQKENVSFGILPKTIETIDTPIIVSYEGITHTFPQATNGTVYLYGDLKDLNMNPLVSAKVQVYLTSNPQTKNGALLDKNILEVYPDETGRWGVLLPSGSLITVVVLNSNFQHTAVLPFVGPINILDLN
jgi:hypothetical protein